MRYGGTNSQLAGERSRTPYAPGRDGVLPEVASPEGGRFAGSGSDRRSPNPEADGDSDRTATVAAQRPAAPVVWSALGRVAGTAWTALKLCHRYVLAPAAMWAVHQLKDYIDEQLAIQRAMERSCPAPTYSESDVRQATDDLGFTRRALGTPYGMVVYLTQMGGRPVAVRQVPLHRLQDVDAFWEEAAAGRALIAAGPHVNLVPYAGCCPALACHVYEQRAGACSLREALLPDSPHGGALGSWEVRVALCRQLMSAAVHLIRSGVCARELSASHVILSLGGGGCGGEEGSSCGAAGSSSSGPVEQGPRCWLAPGCGFRLREAPAPSQVTARQPQQQSQQQQQSVSWAGSYASAGRCSSADRCGRQPFAAEAEMQPGEEFVVMSRALGKLLFQVVAGADSPVPPAKMVLSALSDMVPTRLLSASMGRIVPPLPDEAAWKLFAAIYSLLKFDGSAKPPPEPAAPSGRGGAGRWGGVASSANRAAAGSSAAGGRAATAAAGPASECSRALVRHLVEEAVPMMDEVQFLIRWAAPPAPRAPSAAPTAPAWPEPAPTPVAPAPPPPAHDSFSEASAPPLPMPLQPPQPEPFAVAGPAPPTAIAAPAASESSPLMAAGGAAAVGIAAAPPLPVSPGPAPAAAGSRAGPPDELLCPITHDLMEDPVVAADGHSYERDAITRWLASRRGRPTSPLTGAALPHTNLTPNYALRKIIADWGDQHRL